MRRSPFRSSLDRCGDGENTRGLGGRNANRTRSSTDPSERAREREISTRVLRYCIPSPARGVGYAVTLWRAEIPKRLKWRPGDETAQRPAVAARRGGMFLPTTLFVRGTFLAFGRCPSCRAVPRSRPPEAWARCDRCSARVDVGPFAPRASELRDRRWARRSVPRAGRPSHPARARLR